MAPRLREGSSCSAQHARSLTNPAKQRLQFTPAPHLLPSPSGVGVMPATTMYLPLGTSANLSRTSSRTCGRRQRNGGRAGQQQAGGACHW